MFRISTDIHAALRRRTFLKAALLTPLVGLVSIPIAEARKLSSSQYTVKTDKQGAFWVELHGVKCGKPATLVTGAQRIKIHCVKKDTSWTDIRLSGGAGKSHERTAADYGNVTGVEIDC